MKTYCIDLKDMGGFLAPSNYKDFYQESYFYNLDIIFYDEIFLHSQNKKISMDESIKHLLEQREKQLHNSMFEKLLIETEDTPRYIKIIDKEFNSNRDKYNNYDLEYKLYYQYIDIETKREDIKYYYKKSVCKGSFKKAYVYINTYNRVMLLEKNKYIKIFGYEKIKDDLNNNYLSMCKYHLI